MQIVSVEPFILHVPVTGDGIADSTHTLSHWGAPGVVLRTACGLAGYGYTGTHAHLPTDRLIAACIGETFGPLLLGEDPRAVRALWWRMNRHAPAQWVGRGGITHLAIAALDVALWDLKAKAAGQPLWQLLGGSAGKRIAAYNTDYGWLSLPEDRLVAGMREAVARGYRGVKMKVGSDDWRQDARRLAAVRRAIGPDIALMVDANGKWDLPTAQRFGPALAEHDVRWFEEPIWYDDVEGHRRLAEAITTPIALGEQLYVLDQFRSFIAAGAVHYVQPDAVRLSGITEWWQVAELALAHRLPVVSHAGDMVQIHLHTAIAHPACDSMEYIPWLRPVFTEPAEVVDGHYVAPRQPGAGTTLREDALARYGVG
ncbi:mandelate racemase/muconate lactonizing enzyme family protein [Pseudoroseomonas cervicalis]|uniref:mandelate racemase/muconate lactonizing enzyme family protein n=1 Tax=Teichococcus cervicalis TaxID=204525 RepID=UPI0022F1CE79|nr:mandelate racemase/muconate lactonizing enzyme family protein [Pseudoroseomonas cervicalis]WBV41740.1 mandelate racemase/muconate lactonizing enzyme family protein [Pseudoroseomonas cervicalis]